MPDLYQKELEVALRVVERAGRLTLEYFRTELDIEHKPDATPVTVADRRAEEMLRAELTLAFPEDGLLGEEFGERSGSSGRRWIIDPIDGTQSFVRGVPLYGVLLGLEDHGRCVVGVAGFPALGETLWAARGAGAFRNGARARVSSVTSLAAATLLTSDTTPAHYGDKFGGFMRLLEHSARHRGWGDCYGYALVATGRAEVMIDPQLSPWDSAALVPIVEEAGGTFFDWSGVPTIYGGSGIATSAALSEEVLRVLRGVP
jgi:histidinol phosphatase-like enzyme (inositol monophosphatase family)